MALELSVEYSSIQVILDLEASGKSGNPPRIKKTPFLFFPAGQGSTYQNQPGCGRLGNSDLNPSNTVQDLRLFPGTHTVLD